MAEPMIGIRISQAALYLYAMLGAGLFFAAAYIGIVWWQVRGLRGILLMILFFALSVICSGNLWLHTGNARIPTDVIVAIQRSQWVTILFATLMLADLYAAAHNDHRSLTTRSYLWFKRASKEREHEQT